MLDFCLNYIKFQIEVKSLKAIKYRMRLKIKKYFNKKREAQGFPRDTESVRPRYFANMVCVNDTIGVSSPTSGISGMAPYCPEAKVTASHLCYVLTNSSIRPAEGIEPFITTLQTVSISYNSKSSSRTHSPLFRASCSIRLATTKARSRFRYGLALTRQPLSGLHAFDGSIWL